MSKTTKEQREFLRRTYDQYSHTVKVLDDLEAAESEIAKLRSAISWALGEEGSDFRQRIEGEGLYWWRTELRQRARGKPQPPQPPQESGSE